SCTVCSPPSKPLRRSTAQTANGAIGTHSPSLSSTPARVETRRTEIAALRRTFTGSPLLSSLVEHDPQRAPAWKRPTAGEHRWPAGLAVMGTIVLQMLLPQDLAPRPHYLLPA